MPGLGPTWARTTAKDERSSAWGGEVVLDLFVWRRRRFGWFLEPRHGVTFIDGKKSAGLTVGCSLLLRRPTFLHRYWWACPERPGGWGRCQLGLNFGL